MDAAALNQDLVLRHDLGAFPYFGVHQRFVLSGELHVAPGDDSLLPGVLQDVVDCLDADWPLGAAGSGSGGQPAVGEVLL